MSGLSQVLLVALATDGSDGPTDAAGAVVSGETLARARRCKCRRPNTWRAMMLTHFLPNLTI